MADRPTSVTAIAGLLIAIGTAGIVQQFFSTESQSRHSAEFLWVLALGSLAVFSGFFLLKRYGWARWLSLAWVAAHIGISFLNSLQEVAVHAVFLLLIAYLLFRREANLWFRNQQTAKEI
jgi:hypothetical protein